MNVAVFLPNWVGDAVMATPALAALREHYGHRVRMIGIVRPYLIELLHGTALFDEFWPFESSSRRRRQASFQRIGEVDLEESSTVIPLEQESQIAALAPATEVHGHLSLIRAMRARSIDVVVMMTNSPRPAILSYLGGAKERLGYATRGRGPLLTTKAFYSRRAGRAIPLPMVEYYLRVAELAGVQPTSRRLQLGVTAAQRSRAEQTWQRLGLPTDRPVVGLNPGGAYGNAKRWPREAAADAARAVAQTLGHAVLVLCGPQDYERQTARQIVETADYPGVVSLADETLDLGLVKACIERCWTLVSTDSGPRHIAIALGKPVVTLFGPTDPVWVFNPTARDYPLRPTAECLGCGRRTCREKENTCMHVHTPTAVLERLRAAWDERHLAMAPETPLPTSTGPTRRDVA